MVWVCFILGGLAFGVLGSVGVFLKPLVAEFGWSRGQTSFGYSMLSFSSAIMGVAWGYIADRYGSERLVMAGVFSMVVALLGLSHLTELWHFYAAYFLFGAVGFSTFMGPLFGNVGHWFKHNPGLAMGIAAAGGALGQGVIPFIVRLMISEYDWRTAYFVLAVAYLIIAVPLALAVKDPSSRRQVQTNAPARLDPRYPLPAMEIMGWICAAVIFCCITMAMPIVHVVPLISDRGIAPETAASVLLVLMLAGVAGRIAGGKFADLLGPLPTFVLASAGQTILVIWFPHIDSMIGIYLLAVFFGFAYSADMVSILTCMRLMTPVHLAGRALGLGTAFGMVGMGIGGYLGGVFYDLHGHYVWAFAAAGLSGGINLLILTGLTLRLRLARRRHVRAGTG
jgi:MFS family permease